MAATRYTSIALCSCICVLAFFSNSPSRVALESSSKWRGIVGRKKYTQLNSNAVPSSDSIEPAVYVYDLYGVLGLNRSSPVKDLKQAYLSIAFSNHPDRNSSLDALYLYQNASHAYSVLVRDPEKKRQYDLKYDSDEFVNILGEVGTGVTNVAGPILSKTISSAIPFLRDAFDLSSAAIDALGEDVADDESSMGFFDRISKSIGVKGTEQRIRRTKEKIDSVSKALNDTKVELEDAIESERIASTAYAAVNHLLENKSSEVDNIRSQFTAATNAYTAAKKEESDTKSALRKRDEEVNASLKKSLTISQNMGNTEIEISQLEEALAKKRKQLEELVADQALCTSYLEANVSSTEALRASYSTAVTSKAEREAVYNDVDAKLRVVQQQLEAATRENTAAEDAFRRQRDYLGLVTRRAEDLKKKSADLEERLEEDLKGWVETKTLIETERKRTAELKRKQEEEAAVAAEMANLDMLRQRMDRRNKDLLQIEEDKRRLELEAIEEMAALKKTEENLKARNRIGGQP